MPHHVMQEQHLKRQCAYCRHDMGDDWTSVFSRDRHYKSTTCPNCGKHSRIAVNFDGSGHDDWAGHERWKQDVERDLHNRKPKVIDDEFSGLVDEEFRYLEEGRDDIDLLIP